MTGHRATVNKVSVKLYNVDKSMIVRGNSLGAMSRTCGQIPTATKEDVSASELVEFPSECDSRMSSGLTVSIQGYP